MFNAFSKNKKFISGLVLICLVAVLGIFAFKVNNANAGIVSSFIDISFEGLGWIIARIAAVIHAIVSLFLWLAAMLLEIAFGLEGFTTAPIVTTGWQITRDLVNMFFVLVLLVIAFGTILQIEGYGIKKLLPKLIIVALLINFSLVICGVIIDFSQVATHFFYDEIRENTGLSAQLASAMNIQKTFEISDEASAPEVLAANISGIINVIFSTLTSTLLLLIAAVAIGLGAFFMICRLIMLWILLIMAPLAWFAWILPATASHTKDWWNKFFKWTFFAPIYTFFVWLAIQASYAGSFENIISQEASSVIAESGWAKLGNTLLSTPKFFLQFLCIIGILIGGLMAAQRLGDFASKAAISFAKDQGKNFAGWAGRRAKTFTAPWAEKTEEKLQKASIAKGPSEGKFKRAGRWALGQAARAPRAYVESERTDIKKAEKKYENYTDDNIKKTWKTANLHDRVAMANILNKHGALSADDKFGFKKEDVERAINEAKRYGMHRDMLKTRPDLADKIEGEKGKIEGTIRKLKQKDMENLQMSSLGEIDKKTNKIIKQNEDQKIVQESIKKQFQAGGTWKANHLSEMAKNNPALFDVVMDEIVKEQYESKNLRQDIKNYIESDPGKALLGQKEWIKDKSKINTQSTP